MTVQDDLAEIGAWWARGGPTRGYDPERMFQIAGSPHDQTVPDGVDNPYWELVRHLPSTDDRWDGITPYGYADGLGLRREHFTTRFAWAIPSPGDIAWLGEMLNGRGLVEVGAGSGYWAWQAQQAGIDTVAYEPNDPAGNEFVEGHEYVSIVRDDHTAAGRHQDRALLLCWPSYGAAWAVQALSGYKGDTLVYVGEGEGGCCADDDFFELLAKEWAEIGSSPHHVTWWGIHCQLTAYRRT